MMKAHLTTLAAALVVGNVGVGAVESHAAMVAAALMAE